MELRRKTGTHISKKGPGESTHYFQGKHQKPIWDAGLVQKRTRVIVRNLKGISEKTKLSGKIKTKITSSAK